MCLCSFPKREKVNKNLWRFRWRTNIFFVFDVVSQRKNAESHLIASSWATRKQTRLTWHLNEDQGQFSCSSFLITRLRSFDFGWNKKMFAFYSRCQQLEPNDRSKRERKNRISIDLRAHHEANIFSITSTLFERCLSRSLAFVYLVSFALNLY